MPGILSINSSTLILKTPLTSAPACGTSLFPVVSSGIWPSIVQWFIDNPLAKL